MNLLQAGRPGERDGKPILPTSRRRAARAGPAVQGKDRQALLRADPRQRNGALHAQSLHAVCCSRMPTSSPTRQQDQAAHAGGQEGRSSCSRRSTTRISPPRTRTTPPPSTPSSMATAALSSAPGDRRFRRPVRNARHGAVRTAMPSIPYPQLYPGRDAHYADGHSWVMPHKDRTPNRAPPSAVAEVLRRQRFRLVAHRPPAGVQGRHRQRRSSRRCRIARTLPRSPTTRHAAAAGRPAPVRRSRTSSARKWAPPSPARQDDRRRARQCRTPHQRPACQHLIVAMGKLPQGAWGLRFLRLIFCLR